MFYERVLGVGSDDTERVGFKLRVGDNYQMSHPLKFPSVRSQYDSLVRVENAQCSFPLFLRKRYAFSFSY